MSPASATVIASPAFVNGTSDTTFTINWPGGTGLCLGVFTGGPALTSVTLALNTLTQIKATSAPDNYYIFTAPGGIAANASAALRVQTASAALIKVQVLNLSHANMTPTATFEKLSSGGAHTMGPATVPSNGLAVFFWDCQATETMSGSTEISNTDGGAFRIGTMTTSGSSTMSGSSGTYAVGVGAVFQAG